MKERALVVAVETHALQSSIETELDEFEALAEAAGATILDRMIQRRDTVDPATLVGSGKAVELAERAAELGATLLLVLNDLRPRQRKNLEKIVPLPIVDRTMLILDVFARHARSREGKLQVELAQLRYRQSNLIGIGADLSRLGGGIGTRGPGETKLEVDRRRIGERISALNRMLDDVRRQRAVRRCGAASRAARGACRLHECRQVVAAQRAWRAATRSSPTSPSPRSIPRSRRVYLAPGEYVRIADTVGFITDLPKDLVNAFRATLEELGEADLMLHVLDASNPAVAAPAACGRRDSARSCAR